MNRAIAHSCIPLAAVGRWCNVACTSPALLLSKADYLLVTAGFHMSLEAVAGLVVFETLGVSSPLV